MSSRKHQLKRIRSLAEAQRVQGQDGKDYDFKNNTVNGLPPLEEGDVFFYRGAGSPSAVVTKVRVERIVGRIATLVMLDSQTGEDLGIQSVDMRRVEVVQMCAPVEAKKPEAETAAETQPPADNVAPFQDPGLAVDTIHLSEVQDPTKFDNNNKPNGDDKDGHA